MSLSGVGAPDSSLLWSVEQREWLRALGHEVLVRVPAGTAMATVESTRDRLPDAAPVALSHAPVDAQTPGRAPRGTAADAPPLLRALLHAARRDAVDEAFARLVPEPLALRGDAAAKRALWPALRALRRERRGR